ncbi:hypothetical protein [Bosea sp. PAMC 26642]|uniref:hypothetical protein n=1 Tax=Bosea sp. (strain PAMC 26642) TaxID=1792307 RepID=UPI00077051D3|nr:hypothetical protein [Bosea sp. PAMC 26642]AMJ59046.1 hypothetical protein AXW83_00915 [Bosea sp. PAMC 26642]
MITIFGLLGVAFLGGGVWAIVDGWPYMVLERGFTQVIIGTVAVTGGVILLGLWWLMMELRRVKASVSSAVAALAIANMSAGEPAPVAWPSRPVPQPMPEPAAPDSIEASPATIGLAAAGTALAAGTLAGVASRATEEPAAGPVETVAPKIDPVEEPDTRWLAPELSTAQGFAPLPPRTEPVEDIPEAVHEAEAHDEAAAVPVPDVDPLAAAISAALAEPSIVIPSEERAPPEPSPVVVAHDEADTRPAAESSIWWPEINASAEQDQAAPETAPQPGDDLASLRERLNTGPALPDLSADTPVTEAVQPPADAEKPGTIDAAEAWMNPVFARREPFFGEPSAEPVASEPEWIPSPAVPAAEPEDRASFDDRPREAALSAEPEERTALVPAANMPPAASDEGVIGAYQVGEAHFTLFADGSIRASTPDGDYDFGSMDELKTYLASEKSRLGV